MKVRQNMLGNEKNEPIKIGKQEKLTNQKLRPDLACEVRHVVSCAYIIRLQKSKKKIRR